MKPSNLERLRCATRDEKVAWLRMHLKTSADERRKPVVMVFCHDCDPAHADAMRLQKKCIRKPGWKPRWT